ncbi:hypothetical protein F2Q70_00031932 [Brassica cretica]|uniref:Uncharacterized protein n=1 Tax=Brassica cretica TaxID=69181 RepID=A0A8S9FCF2_BRACR|nr:hypothetical protein F2Q70_00031932 [Brassica cretica]
MSVRIPLFSCSVWRSKVLAVVASSPLLRACYSMGLMEGCNPSPTISPPSSLVSGAAVSVNLRVRLIRIAGSNARDGNRFCWLTGDRFEQRSRIDSGLTTRSKTGFSEKPNRRESLPFAFVIPFFRFRNMPPRSRLSREEKGKGVADSPSTIRVALATNSPLDDFDLIHRDALRDTENMTLSQRLLVADDHRMIPDECADRVEVGSSDVSGSGSEASSQASRPLRRASREVPFDQIDCRPTIYHPGGIFEELSPLPPELLRDPRAHRLSREEKGKGVADSPSPIRDARVTDSPPDDFDLIHRDALRDSDNMTLSQRLLVADAHKMIRDECADRVEVGSSDVSGSGSEASSQASRPLRRASREVPFDQIDCRPTIYHPGGIFEELCPLPSELLQKFFESAQAIAAHIHLRWPDLSREWIRRQEARIARVDWESRLPVVLGPRKSRLSLFTRKQQKLLDEARKMDGVPDLSALLKGKLQLLLKKSIPADVQGSTSSDAYRASKEGAPGLVNVGVGVEPSASSPKKKKKSKKSRRKATEELPLEEIASLDETSEGLEARKEEGGRKRTYEGATSSVDHGEAPAVGREEIYRGGAASF